MIIYRLLRLFINVVIFLLLLYKKEFWLKRIFSYRKIDDKIIIDYIWIHLSSVGELNLSEGIIKELLEKRKENILISVFTDTGYDLANKRYGGNIRVKIIYFPVDFRFAIKNILKRINLKLLVIIETEIWPNLIELCSKNSKIVMINGRISDKSINKYMKLKFLLKPLLKKISYAVMQSENDVYRIGLLGMQNDKIINAGNLKYDVNFEKYDERSIKELKEKIGAINKKILVGGSTHPLEEELIVRFISENNDWYGIIVPRHIERCENIKNEILQNVKYSIFSENYDKDSNIMLVDKMGILRQFYQMADAVFVGGTFANVGGHSLLEPLYYGKMPIFGPNIQNVKEISKLILETEIGYKFRNYNEFKEKVLLSISEKGKKNNIEKFFKENKGVQEKVIKILLTLLEN